MFAGAAREAVFSNPEVVKRVKTAFVPVALKAAHVNRPPGGAEGRLLAEIGRSKPAPQGICVANPSGKVLAWALNFDDEASVLRFLDYAVARYAKFPDASKPVPVERFMRYPSNKLGTVADTRDVLPAALPHGKGTFCPATPPVPPGTLIANLVGRRAGKDGTLAADCRSQEHYVEDVFHVPTSEQAELARALAAGTPEKTPMPRALVRRIATFAHLGQLDVRPLSPPVPGNREIVRSLDLSLTKAGTGRNGASRWRIRGITDVGGRSGDRSRPDGASFVHDVELAWSGYVDLSGERIVELVLSGNGTERLRWGNPRFSAMAKEPDVAHLPAGRAIDFESSARYGIVARPAPKERTSASATLPGVSGGAGGSMSDRLRRLGRVLEHARELLRMGRVEEARRVLDHALRLLPKTDR